MRLSTVVAILMTLHASPSLGQRRGSVPGQGWSMYREQVQPLSDDEWATVSEALHYTQPESGCEYEPAFPRDPEVEVFRFDPPSAPGGGSESGANGKHSRARANVAFARYGEAPQIAISGDVLRNDHPAVIASTIDHELGHIDQTKDGKSQDIETPAGKFHHHEIYRAQIEAMCRFARCTLLKSAAMSAQGDEEGAQEAEDAWSAICDALKSRRKTASRKYFDHAKQHHDSVRSPEKPPFERIRRCDCCSGQWLRANQDSLCECFDEEGDG